MDKDELLRLLKDDVAKFNEMRKSNQEPVDLSGCDLSGASLKGADLRRLNLSGARFQRADLAEAELTGCNLVGGDLQGANLEGANLHHSNLRKADLRGARFIPLTTVPRGRFCVHPASFEGVRWDKGHLEQILSVLNLNRDWEIKYQIVPKDRKD